MALVRYLVTRRNALPKRILAAARVAGLLASLAVVAWVADRGVRAVNLATIRPGLLAGSLGAGLLAWLGLGRGWAALTAASSPAQALATWSRTQALRYLPGAIWAPASRAATVPGRRRRQVATVVAEAVVTLAAAVTVGGILLAAGGSPWWAVALLALPLALAVPAVLALPAVLARLAPRRRPPPPAGVGPGVVGSGEAGAQPAAPAVSSTRVRAGLAWYLGSWVAYGASVALAQAAVGPLGSPWRVAGAGCLAWAAGFVTIIAPSGAGAREVAYLALLAGTGPRGRLAAGAVTSRLTFTAAELVVLAVVVAQRLRARESSAAP